MNRLPHRTLVRTTRGFTLVELLVAITILAILAAIAISSFSETGSDRVPAAARQFRAMLGGAQSRAAKDKAARGVRLILDPNLQVDAQNIYVTSLAYVGANTDIEGALADQTIPATASNPQRTVQLKPDGLGWRIKQDPNEIVNWTSLASPPPPEAPRVQVGDRVYLQWTVEDEIETQERMFIINFIGDDAGAKFFRLAGPEPPPSLTGNIRYRLEISPELLPNSEPVSFPRGTCIDLNASKLPANTLAISNPNCIRNTGALDIMFDQRGQVRGSLAGEGAVHFYVGQIEDSLGDRLINPMETSRVINGSDAAPVVYPQRIVSLIPATGQVVASEYVASNPADPFFLATQGREAR